jgi:monoamine oxidase
MPETFDIIIIGAGAAGLSCARDLSGAGKRICILEARDRVGGRILTRHAADLPLPIELGAEFIHGEAHTTFAIVEAAALTAYELPDDHWWCAGGRWTEVKDFWGAIDRIRARIRPHHDISFAEFLKTQRSLKPRLRQMALGFVEGYHASHADRISALALRGSDQEQEEPGGNKQFRIANGYDALIEWLRAGLDPERTSLRLGTPVEEVRWKRGEVIVLAGGEEFRAGSCVVTVPAGVLKSPDGIRFTPDLTTKRGALEKIEAGHVVKIVFRFRERFWDDFNFVHSSDRYVPTIWTAAPVRAPILTAWAGGHAADRMLTDGAPVERALDSIAATFGMKRKQIDKLLDAAHWHNWQADPFSRGAYSYAAVGGVRAHGQLAKPLQSTLFFAGEATSGDQTGTVAGAVDSGRRAAREVLGGNR